MNTDRNKDFKIMASIALCVLAISIFISLFSALHWATDLLSHFYIQYSFGGLFLSVAFVLFKHYKRAALAATISVACFIYTGTHFNYSNPETSENAQTLKVLQYNRNYRLYDHSQFIEFLKTKQPDIVVIQEATYSHSTTASNAKELYPYQIHEPRKNAFGMVIMSRCPIRNQQVKKFERIALDNIQVRFSVDCPKLEPVTFYAIHPPPPTNKKLNAQRNMELTSTAKDISKDDSSNIIMMGDWNISPFSPVFKDTLKTSSLKHEHAGNTPFPTWPSMFFLPFFQLPIDHILHKGKLHLVSKERIQAFDSDHYPVLATYTFEKP